MGKSICMFQGRHAYVDEYYAKGAWVSLPPWQDLQYPVITHAGIDRKNPNRVTTTKDVKAGGVYDETTCLMGYLHDEEVSFEELEAFASLIGWGGTFVKRVMVFVGGTHPLRKGIMTGAGLQPFNAQWDSDWWEKRLAKDGIEAWATGKNAVVCEV